ncbi:manganese efflux pump MntP family protein [Bacillus swezeyi]|uniref:Putative manganese efflux pump MntP n=1 Tax=Bacillus swezeyi TaxID=1925020 RepID=A0A1R1QWJ8_9BACI|nr:manganese efflux pump MntP family protein [Bacillus swezeyi]MEC1259263.1 manganese efflux pump MntP family protein [Bacillus swezeyi]MED2927775.1 manganese efflux pump MntP family protein [Bacillus swezeyi]MED2942034.1 manganese efflux pump MntP family protein [Bacillus swezeyi]MED2965312.1 manganese efflux pump MntP family protein [Bacillus swezeyi]MED2977582.1 manganese efflux pump MntP family protein [Bacillus swezeyi]
MNVDVLIGEILTLSIMAFALGMDAFSVGLGMGMAKLRRSQIFQIGVIIGLFHVIMPLGGMIAGQFLSDALGALAGYIGGALLLVLGIQMIAASLNKSGEQMISPNGFGLFIFAVGVSLDSFSVGLSLGLYGTKPILTICLFGLFSMVLTWAGLLLGKQVQSWIGAYSEALGGAILLSFGLKLLLPI